MSKSVIKASARLSPNGRVVIPAAMREALGVSPGDSLVMEIEDGILHIEPYLARIRRIQKEFAHLAPSDHYVSDDLIAERRRDALLERESLERARELRRIHDGYQSAECEPQEKPPGAHHPPKDQIA